jgi:hypothetical protein
VAQRILDVLYHLTTKDDNKCNYETEDIVEAHNDMYRSRLYATRATKKLHELKLDCMVREVDIAETISERRMKAWKLEHPKRVLLFLNKNYYSKKRRVMEGQVNHLKAASKKTKISFSLMACDRLLYIL